MARAARCHLGQQQQEALAAPLRVKRVWYRLPDALVPAWYVEVQVNDKASRHGTDAYSYVVSATDGTLLFRNSLVADAAFPAARVYAETAPPFLPLPGPGGRGGFPHPTGQPDGYQPPIQPRNLVTLQNAPFSRNDPWLTDPRTGPSATTSKRTPKCSSPTASARRGSNSAT